MFWESGLSSTWNVDIKLLIQYPSTILGEALSTISEGTVPWHSTFGKDHPCLIRLHAIALATASSFLRLYIT